MANSGALLGLWTCWVQRHIVGLYWVPGLAGVRGNEIADKFARDGSVPKFVGHEPSLGLSTENIRRQIKCWLDNQHLAKWRCLSSVQRQARKMISGPISTTKTRFLYFNGIQSKVVIGLHTGYYIPRKHLHLMWLTNSPLYRRSVVGEETSAPVLCECEECESLASLRRLYLGSFSWTQRTLGI